MNIPFLLPRTSAERTAASEGLRTTLAFLSETDNEAAAAVLIPALDSPLRAVRQGALEAILARPNRAGHRAVIARLHAVGPEERSLIEKNHHRMTTALREAILDRDQQMFVNGCQAAVWFRLYDVVPTLLTALEEAGEPRAATLGRTLIDLVGQLCREMTASRRSGRRPDPQSGHQHVISPLEVSVHRFGRHHRRETVEALALLAHRDNATLNQILEDPRHPAFVALMEVLSKSSRGPVLRLVLSYLDDAKAPSAALSVVGNRVDPEFVGRLLRKIARETSPVMVQNLKRLGGVAWAHDSAALLDHVDEASQRAAVRLVVLSGISRAIAFKVVKHLLLRGKLEGRRAAVEALKQFQGAEANALAMEALDDDDPEVQAQTLLQLRGRGIVGAMVRVVGMLDSPHAPVRRAARRSMAEFTFPRFVAAYDVLDAQVRQSTGEIVKKVDPHTVPLLQAEMTSRARTRRRRALAIARTLDLVESVEGPIVRLLEDEDHGVRADAAAALASCQSQASYDALTAALADRSLTVREVARKSLAERARAGVPIPPAGAVPEKETAPFQAAWHTVAEGFKEPSP